jgi:sugar phosphate isomerase/epimerase
MKTTRMIPNNSKHLSASRWSRREVLAISSAAVISCGIAVIPCGIAGADERLGEWVRLAEATHTTIAIKPHRGGVVSQPVEAVWLFEQLGKPDRLRMVYDYSHYSFRDLPMPETIEISLPYVAHVAVKDVAREHNRVVFTLPGEGGHIDFAKLIRRLHAGGYRGDINCEVSGMVSKQRGYDAVAAARVCYRNLSAAFNRSGVRRPG